MRPPLATAAATYRRPRRFGLWLGLFLIGTVVIGALLSFVWLPQDPLRMNFAVQLTPPSAENWLGADHFGRDLLSRLLVGARSTLYVGFIAVGIALLAGGAIGAIAGFVGGVIDELMMRLVDVLYAFPAILMALLLAAVYRPGTLTAMTAIGLATVPIFARIARASVLSIKEREFVEAGRSLGYSDNRLMFGHILPNIMPEILVMGSLWLATAIRVEASLAFIGLGVSPPTATWGGMIREGFENILDSMYLAVFPGIAILIVVFALNLLGDGLRDAIDPKLRGES